MARTNWSSQSNKPASWQKVVGKANKEKHYTLVSTSLASTKQPQLYLKLTQQQKAIVANTLLETHVSTKKYCNGVQMQDFPFCQNKH